MNLQQQQQKRRTHFLNPAAPDCVFLVCGMHSLQKAILNL